MNIKSLNSYLYATPRTLLFYFAVLTLLLSVTVSGLSFTLNIPVLYITGSVILVAWFILIFMSVLPQTDIMLSNQMNQLKRRVIGIFIGLFVLGLLEAVTVGVLVPHFLKNQNMPSGFSQVLAEIKRDYEYNDATALSQQAVDNLLEGKNPYAHANIVQALLKYNSTYDRVTPLRVGVFSEVFPAPQNSKLEQLWNKAVQTPSQVPPEIESDVCYPAGSFLLPAPFIFLGITDIRIVYTIFLLAGLAYALWIIPKKKRLLFIGVVLISLELWNSILDGGELGNICFPLLLIAWLALNRNLWLSAICMGLAVATKQTAWFFLPFYLILIFKTAGVKKVAVVISIIAGVFLATNLPFVIADPKLWLNSVTSPMTDQMFPLGSGLVTLVTSGLMNIQSSLPFTILEVISCVVAIVWYFKYCKRYPQTGPVLAIVPLFFAWRSLFSYFFYVDIILMAYILVNDDSGWQPNLTGANSPENKPGIQVAAGK
jgi:hypothetical protein